MIARDIFAEALAEAALERRRANALKARLEIAQSFVADKMAAAHDIARREISASRGLTTQTWHRATAEIAALQIVAAVLVDSSR